MMTVTDQTFAALLDGTAPVLVMFSATWCQPCKAMTPALDALATEWDGRVVVVKADIEEARRAAEGARVKAVPTFALYRGGRILVTLAGVQVPQLRRAVEEALR